MFYLVFYTQLKVYKLKQESKISETDIKMHNRL